MIKRWHFSFVLGIVYICVFHLWRNCTTFKQVAVSGGIVAFLLSVLVITNLSYFVSNTDILIHALVILDILLEALLIFPHDNLGFYYCALAFAIVIVPFRLWQMRKKTIDDGQ